MHIRIIQKSSLIQDLRFQIILSKSVNNFVRYYVHQQTHRQADAGYHIYLPYFVYQWKLPTF